MTITGVVPSLGVVSDYVAAAANLRIGEKESPQNVRIS